jgi:NADPH-dependent FMN reductase
LRTCQQNEKEKWPVIRIGIILGSTRPNRNGEQVARWVYDIASQRDDAEFELVDLRDYPLPHLDEPVSPSFGHYQHEHTKGMGGQDRLVRRVRHGDPGVQPLHLRGAEERD